MTVNGKKVTYPCAFIKVDNQDYQDFGISTGKRRACTYYSSQETCGGPQTSANSNFYLNGQSFNRQRAETLMTITGWIRGSFVSTLHFYNKFFSLIWPNIFNVTSIHQFILANSKVIHTKYSKH